VDRPAGTWIQELRSYREEWEAWLGEQAMNRSGLMHPAALFEELKAGLPADVLYSWDGGDFVHWGRAMLPALTPGGWARLGPLATIGAALPNALALQLANQARPVVAITGDGALGFYIAELDTLVRQRLPTVVIRPGRPNKAASSFVSAILREPLLGLPTELPVPEDFALWICSPRRAVEWLLHAMTMETAPLGADRGINPPGRSATVAKMLGALEEVAGPGALALVRRAPDPAVRSRSKLPSVSISSGRMRGISRLRSSGAV
jgi:hypothetical protein